MVTGATITKELNMSGITVFVAARPHPHANRWRRLAYCLEQLARHPPGSSMASKIRRETRFILERVIEPGKVDFIASALEWMARSGDLRLA